MLLNDSRLKFNQDVMIQKQVALARRPLLFFHANGLLSIRTGGSEETTALPSFHHLSETTTPS